MINYKTLISGTATGLRISAVDLAAFIDNDATIPLYADGRSIIRIYDSSNKYLEGVLGNVGSGETVGDEQISSWFNSTSNPFETFTVSGTNIISAINTTDSARADIGEKTLYAIYKAVLDVTINSGSGLEWCVGRLSGTFSPNIIVPVIAGINTIYLTTLYIPTEERKVLGFYAGATIDFSSTCSVKQVLTPSTSGCTILNAAGAQSFISKDANFTYNAESYTYKIFANKRVVI